MRVPLSFFYLHTDLGFLLLICLRRSLLLHRVLVCMHMYTVCRVSTCHKKVEEQLWTVLTAHLSLHPSVGPMVNKAPMNAVFFCGFGRKPFSDDLMLRCLPNPQRRVRVCITCDRQTRVTHTHMGACACMIGTRPMRTHENGHAREHAAKSERTHVTHALQLGIHVNLNSKFAASFAVPTTYILTFAFCQWHLSIVDSVCRVNLFGQLW